MRALAARRLLCKHCRHTEEWRCGKATVSSLSFNVATIFPTSGKWLITSCYYSRQQIEYHFIDVNKMIMNLMKIQLSRNP